MEEFDPYKQHGEVPAVGYIDPPVEPYRYISPVKRDNIYTKGLVRHGSTLGGSACIHCGGGATKAKVSSAEIGCQTTLTMEQINTLLLSSTSGCVSSSSVGGASAAPTRSNSAGGASKRVSAVARRPVEPVRSSSSKKAPLISTPTTSSLAPRAKSSSKAPIIVGGGGDAVVAAPRSTRIGSAVSGSPAVKSLPQDGGASPALARPAQDAIPPRRMFSGSGNNGVAVTRTPSANKVPTVASAAAPSSSLLKRGKSSERPAGITLVGGTGGSSSVALQAALARNLLRKQATGAPATSVGKSSDQFSTQHSANGRRTVSGEFTTVDGSPSKPANTLAASLPSTLSTPSNPSLARVGGPGGRAPSQAPGGASLISTLNPPPPAKFSRGPSAGSQNASTTVISAAAPKRQPPTPTGTSGSVATKRVTATPNVTPVAKPTGAVAHVDPTADVITEVKKAQGLNQQIVHQQASLDDREKARQWQQRADEKTK